MNPGSRVIFDTSTLISAALREGSVPDQAVTKAFASCVVCASAETLDELERVLRNDRFDSYLGKNARQSFVVLICERTRLFAIQDSEKAKVVNACRDPKDAVFLALALASGADLIVSSDSDLLVLHPWHGVSILTPAQFVAG